jgi:VanZ family protein
MATFPAASGWRDGLLLRTMKLTSALRVSVVRLLMAAWLFTWAAFSLPWTSASSIPHWDRVALPRFRATSRVRPDHLLNVLFYVPFAPLGAALGQSLRACTLAGGALSLTAEAAQLFSSERAPDGNDLIANIAGTTIGTFTVMLYRRRFHRR